jgi:hypothetical protein
MIPALSLTVILGLILDGHVREAQKPPNSFAPDAGLSEILRDAPLTITFSKHTGDRPPHGDPYSWIWSINSAGQGERTICFFPKITGPGPDAKREKFTLSPERMNAIRKALHEEQFFAMKDHYGPIFIHGSWSTLTVTARQWTKAVRFYSTPSWAAEPNREDLSGLTSASRVWLAVCEGVDPDREFFPERKKLAEAIRALKK